MTRFVLESPRLMAHAVHFQWRVDPPSALYKRTEFTLRFPETIDLTRVPERVWPVIAMVCLHPHWVLLRPCRVELPFRLGPDEEEFWYRLLDAAIATLETSRGGEDFGRSIEIRGSGVELPAFPLLPDTGRCATAFSGGKDSLVQTGILVELTEKPVLVATTSPMPPIEDHSIPRRQWLFEEIQKRSDVTFVEVESDFRTTFVTSFPWAAWRYASAVNELTDTLLYFSSLLVASIALGATHLFMASEVEVQENAERGGRIVQHPHFMYSAPTLRALEALLAPLGIHFGSLTSPLHSAQIQQLLWTRYRNLRDLQHSCWKMNADEAACNHCSDCLKIGLNAVILGDRPSMAGIQLGKVLREMSNWTPRKLAPHEIPPSPQQATSMRLSIHLARYLRAVRLRQILKTLEQDSPGELSTLKGWGAVASFIRLRYRARKYARTKPPGYRKGFLALVDPLLRDRVEAIFAEHFEPEPEADYAAILERTNRLAAWLTEPLAAREDAAAKTGSV